MHQRAFDKSPLSIDSAARPAYDRSSGYIVVDRNEIPAGADFGEFQYSQTYDARPRSPSPFRSPLLSAKSTKFSSLTVNLLRKSVNQLSISRSKKANECASRNSHSKSKSSSDVTANSRASNTGAQRSLEVGLATSRSTPNLVQAAMTSPRPQGGIWDDVFDLTPLDASSNSDSEDFETGPPTPPKDRIVFAEAMVTRSRFGVALDGIEQRSQRKSQRRTRNRASSLSIPVDVSCDTMLASPSRQLEDDDLSSIDITLHVSG